MERYYVERHIQMVRYTQMGPPRTNMHHPNSKSKDRHVSTNISHVYTTLTVIQGSKFHVGDVVYIQIMDCTGRFQRRGPYLVANVLIANALIANVPEGYKYILCYYNGPIAESGREIEEKDLVAG